MKKYLLIILALFSLFAVSYSHSTFVIPFTQTSVGNEGSGGGNGFPTYPVSKSDIEYFLSSKEFRHKTEAIVYNLFERANNTEWGCSDPYGGNDPCEPDHYENVMKKIQNYGEAEFVALLKNTQFEIQSHGPCYDLTKQPAAPVDAFANTEMGIICFSTDRLSQKGYDEKAATKNILALLMHELTHFIGATEDEAQALQSHLLYFPIENTDLSQIKMDAISAIFELQHSLASKGFLKYKSLGDACLWAGTMISDVDHLEDVLRQPRIGTGMLLRPISELKKMDSIYLLLSAALGFCLKDLRPAYDGMFKENSGGLRDYTDSNGVLIRYVKLNDRKTTAQNLANVRVLLDELLVNIRKSEVPGDCMYNEGSADGSDWSCSNAPEDFSKKEQSNTSFYRDHVRLKLKAFTTR